MKKSIALLGLLLFASTSFATHVYRSETCTSQSTDQVYKLVYKGDFAKGGPSGLSKVGSDEEVTLWEKGNESSAGENLFEVLHGKVIKTKVQTDHCLKGYKTTLRNEHNRTQTVVNIANLSAEDEDKLGLKSGTYIIFNCTSQLSTPVKCK
jgi:hypothetical protein